MKFCAVMLLILGLVMTVTILLQVFFRFVVYVPLPWSEELARYLMIWMGMLGSVVALHEGRHIGIQVLVERLSARTRAWVTMLVKLTMIAFLGIILKEGLGLALFNMDQRSAAMEIPMLIPYAAIPAGAAMMIVDILADLMPAPLSAPVAVSNPGMATDPAGQSHGNRGDQ